VDTGRNFTLSAVSEGPGEKLQLLGGRYLLAPSASHERDEADAKGSSCCDHDGR
jgi:hypothetical protein